jgi:hypothetical protein
MQSGGGCAVMIGLLRYSEARAENSAACAAFFQASLVSQRPSNIQSQRATLS